MTHHMAQHLGQQKVGLIYRNVWIYRIVMRLLYKTHYNDKYQLVAEEIPPNSLVVDLCCGDAVIAPLLQKKGCRYIGLDINEKFVEWGQNKGLDVRLWDVSQLQIPEGDVICIQSALFQFIPNEKRLFDLMIKNARKKVIISEPMLNWKSWAYRKLAMFFTQVKGRVFSKRLSEEDVLNLAKDLPQNTVKIKRIPRELILVVDVEEIRRSKTRQ
jgi:trans-aconitate methyltransferase